MKFISNFLHFKKVFQILFWYNWTKETKKWLSFLFIYTIIYITLPQIIWFYTDGYYWKWFILGHIIYIGLGTIVVWLLHDRWKFIDWFFALCYVNTLLELFGIFFLKIRFTTVFILFVLIFIWFISDAILLENLMTKKKLLEILLYGII